MADSKASNNSVLVVGRLVVDDDEVGFFTDSMFDTFRIGFSLNNQRSTELIARHPWDLGSGILPESSLSGNMSFKNFLKRSVSDFKRPSKLGGGGL